MILVIDCLNEAVKALPVLLICIGFLAIFGITPLIIEANKKTHGTDQIKVEKYVRPSGSKNFLLNDPGFPVVSEHSLLTG